VTTAYTHGVLILSLGGQVGHDLVGSSNALVNGAALSLFAITSGAVGIAARGLRPQPAMLWGALASVASMGLLALAVARHELAIFLAATAIAGVGYSLLVVGGLALIGGAVPERQRGGVLSALYLFAYLSLGTVALGLGVVATERGSAWRWIWAPPRSPCSASARSASSPSSRCTTEMCRPCPQRRRRQDRWLILSGRGGQLMKLYHSTASPNSRRVRMFIAEKGIAIPFQPVNLAEKEQFSDAFKAINPRQQVPVLVLDDGTAIAEVPAIWRFRGEPPRASAARGRRDRQGTRGHVGAPGRARQVRRPWKACNSVPG
jgi:hypothetical protein